MCSHGLTWPERTYFLRGVVTHCKKRRGEVLRDRKPDPGLAANACGTQPCLFDLTDGFRPHSSGGMTPGTVGSKVLAAFAVHDRLGHDRSG